MDEQLTQKIQILCAWCGPAFVLLYGIAWVVLGHNYPPPDPAYTATELVNNYYLKYRSDIMLGESLSTAFGILYLVWACQVSIQMWRRECVPILSLIQLAGGLLTGWLLMFAPCMWVWCAEMAGKVDPELIKMVHFVAWYFFDMTYWITTIEVTAIFILVMTDRQKPGLVPKWVAAVALFSGLSFLPLTFLPYVQSGPFAINGFWSFDVTFISYGVFTFAFGPYMARDIRRKRAPAAA